MLLQYVTYSSCKTNLQAVGVSLPKPGCGGGGLAICNDVELMKAAGCVGLVFTSEQSGSVLRSIKSTEIVIRQWLIMC